MSNMMSGDDGDSDPEPELEPWVLIQQNTFTNWMNDKLRPRSMEVENLRTELKDGIKLCRLVEVLIGEKMRGVLVKKNLRKTEAYGNLALALETLQRDGVRLVNIGMVILFILIVQLFYCIKCRISLVPKSSLSSAPE